MLNIYYPVLSQGLSEHMRVFSIQQDGKFVEYLRTPFQVEHEESTLEEWLESNPDGILEDSNILIIGRQVSTNLGGIIDLLGLDRYGNVVVIELKRDRTPRETIAQVLEYVSFVEDLDVEQLSSIMTKYYSDETICITELHRDYFQLDPNDAVAFNKDQRMVILGQCITPEIRQTASYLRTKGLKLTCVEFTFFQATEGTKLFSQEIVIGKEADKSIQITASPIPVVTEEIFMSSLDGFGKDVFSKILTHARERLMPIHWGSKGFSLNVEIEGSHVGVCLGYPPGSVFKQSIYSMFYKHNGTFAKCAVPESMQEELYDIIKSSSLFVSAGREYKYLINNSISDDEMSLILRWIDRLSEVVKTYGLKEL